MALAEVDSAAIAGHSVDGDKRMFLTRANKPCAAAVGGSPPNPGPALAALPAGGAVEPAGPWAGRGAITAADIGSGCGAAGCTEPPTAAPQKLQNFAPSGTGLPH